MNIKSTALITSIFATSMVMPAFADSEGTHDEPVQPTITHQNGGMMGGAQGGMPMMNGPQGGMPMMNGPQGGMPMMRGGRGGMPMMQMMQKKQAMMQQHMRTVEGRLANIEALLKQLVALQKR
ncbi:MAG TPA: hypothetical protein ENJ35_01005 [Gammaproteobacteria bacterium]|nr:hypothetical protein [Gammaproteobacteria bacterium]